MFPSMSPHTLSKIKHEMNAGSCLHSGFRSHFINQTMQLRNTKEVLELRADQGEPHPGSFSHQACLP